MPLDLLMFAGLVGGILLGYPVSFTIIGVATIFALLGWATGQFDISLMGAVGQRMYGLLTNPVLIAIPLFVFMGVILQKSRIAEHLLETMGRLFGPMRGGLGVSVAVVGALLAASTGIVGATVIAMGLMALPTMLRHNYSAPLACGIVCSSGTLGQIIPPSTLLIILSDVMSNAFQQAQFKQGKFSVDTISVGEIFAAAIVPGFLLVFIYIIYIFGRAMIRPHEAPPIAELGERVAWGDVLRAVLAPILLIVIVLGSIVGGLATPTESAAIGAVGALFLAGLRLASNKRPILLGATALIGLAIAVRILPIQLQRSDAMFWEWIAGGAYLVLICAGLAALYLVLKETVRENILKEALTSSMTITAMIFATILTAGVFSLVFVGLGGEERVHGILSSLPGGAIGALLFSMAFIFVLGFFLDFVEITVIVLPVLAPVLMLMGHDPMLLSILIALNLQTSFLTPPFGFSLFYLRGAAPAEIRTGQIYQGVAPFIVLQVFVMVMIWYFPGLATALPKFLF